MSVAFTEPGVYMCFFFLTHSLAEQNWNFLTTQNLGG